MQFQEGAILLWTQYWGLGTLSGGQLKQQFAGTVAPSDEQCV